MHFHDAFSDHSVCSDTALLQWISEYAVRTFQTVRCRILTTLGSRRLLCDARLQPKVGKPVGLPVQRTVRGISAGHLELSDSHTPFTRSSRHRANIELAQAGLLEPRPLAQM